MSNNPDFRSFFQSVLDFLCKQLSGLGKFNKKALHENRSCSQQFYAMCTNSLNSSNERIKNGLPPNEARKEREFQTALFKMAYEKSRDDQKLILKLSARQFLLIVLCAIFIGALCFGSHLQNIPEEAFSSMPVSDIDKPEKMCYTEPYDNNAGSLSPQNLP